MRYPSDHKDAARAKILQAVGRGFRAQGFAGIGVDGLAKEAGVTSGAFYGHFSSKAEAFEAAAVAGIVELRQAVETLQRDHPETWLRQFAEFYLSLKRVCRLEESCALQSLTPEVARAGEDTKAAYEAELLKLVEQVAAGFPSGAISLRRKRAWALLALLSGGVTLARASHSAEVGSQIAKGVVDAALRIASPKAG